MVGLNNTYSEITSTDSPEFMRRVHLVRNSIYGSILSFGSGYTPYFYRIISRVCILVQLPVCFILYEKKENDYHRSNKILIREKESYDVLYNNITENKYHKSDVKVIDKNGMGDLFRIFRTKYYLMAFYIDYDYEHEASDKTQMFRRVQKHDNGEQILSVDDYIFHAIRDVLSSYQEKYGVPLSYDFKKIIIRSIENIPEPNQGEIVNRVNSSESNVKFDEESVFNSIYEDKKDSLILSGGITKKRSKIKNISNILLYFRDYTNQNNCRDKYNHNIKLLIPSSQSKDIKTVLNRLKTNFPSASKKSIAKNKNHYLRHVYDVESGNKLVDEETYQLAVKSYNKFRRILVGEDTILISGIRTTGVKAITLILKNYFGSGAVSFSDSVFDNRTVHFRGIFKDGGLGRVERSNTVQNQLDRVRIVAAHYLFSSMCQAEGGLEPGEQLHMMLVPVEVGGCDWGVIGNVIKINKKKSYNDRDTWNLVYHLYQNIDVPIEKSLRVEIRKSYINTLLNSVNNNGNYIDSLSLSSALGKMMVAEKNEAEEMINLINKKNEQLKYIYPYPRVKFTLKAVGDKVETNFINGYNIAISLINDDETFVYDRIIRSDINQRLEKLINQNIEIKSKQAFDDLVTYGIQVHGEIEGNDDETMQTFEQPLH